MAMEKTFSFYSRRETKNWIFLIFVSIALLIFGAIMTFMLFKNEDASAIMIAMTCAIFIPWFMIFHRMFIAKISISDNEIRYKSLFKKKSIQLNEIKAFDLVKKSRRMPAKFLPFETETEFTLGGYFYLIRKTFKYPEGPFIALKPITNDYILIQARPDVYESLKLVNAGLLIKK